MFRFFLNPILVLFLFIFLSPLIIFIILAIFFFDGLPIFFVQDRLGFQGKTFKLYKFRTMTNANKNNDRARITKLGKFLRETKFDELPQLYNIFKLDLSFVGPRPLLTEYLKFFNKFERKRFSINPGLTGWAQIHEKRNTTWKKRLELDIWYVHNRSIYLDFLIIVKTFLLIINSLLNKKKRINLLSKRFDVK